MRLLVSGIAGDIGFGVGRIIKEWGIATKLFGIDIYENHPGEFIFDKCDKSPHAADKNYFDWIRSFIKKNSIDLFIPTSEAEISLISSLRETKIENATILINNSFTVENCLDKYKSLHYLEQKGIKVPKNGLIAEGSPKKFPVLVKPRFGQGSKGIKILSNKKEFDKCKSNLIWQELLLPNNEEYTCPVYLNKKKELRVLIIKRCLKNGMTHNGIVVTNKVVEKYLKKIVNVLGVIGSVNIQLILTKEGPLLFEINPRLSGTIVFRDKIGFKDLRWWVSDTLGLKVARYYSPKNGIKFYRGYTEYIK